MNCAGDFRVRASSRSSSTECCCNGRPRSTVYAGPTRRRRLWVMPCKSASICTERRLKHDEAPGRETKRMLKSVQSAPLIRIRWRIFSLLFGFGFLAYLQQKSITVAAELMMPDLGLSQFQISLIEWAFVLGYGLFQVPGGIFGQRQGARRTFVIIGLAAFLATVATPLAPYWLTGGSLFVALLLVQLLLGCSQAATFPVSAGVFERWFPPRSWPTVQGLQPMGLSLGAALTPPLIAHLMSAMGRQP